MRCAFAFVDQPSPDLAVAVFGRDRGEWLELMRLSQEVSRIIREAFSQGQTHISRNNAVRIPNASTEDISAGAG